MKHIYTKEQDKRWVLVAPPKHTGAAILLAEASGSRQQTYIGKQAGGRVFLFLSTDDFWRDYHRMLANGVTFARKPVEQPYGTVAVFEDLYGNLWDLIEHQAGSRFSQHQDDEPFRASAGMLLYTQARARKSGLNAT